MKEDFFRNVVIGGIKEEQFSSLPEFEGWCYQGVQNCGGVSRHVFMNHEIGCQILFEKEDSNFRSTNVLPIDGTNLNSPNYLEGCDSSEEQAEDLTRDVLYDFCIQLIIMAQKAGSHWWCAIIPSVSDLWTAIEDARQHRNLIGPFDSAKEAVVSMLEGV